MTYTGNIIFEITKVFFIYTFLCVIFPEIIIGKYTKKRTIFEKFMIDIVIGNAYFINIVFILELLKISNKYTLFFLGFFPGIFFLIFRNRNKLYKYLKKLINDISKINSKTMGIKTFFYKRISKKITYLIINFKKHLQFLLHNIIEITLFIAIIGVIIYIYGKTILINHCYTASDIAVHNYWINALSKNDVFVAGVYPFGFHCMIYFIHTIFNIDTYKILIVFSITQTLYLHLVLLMFIRQISRSKYPSYICVIIYAGLELFTVNCVSRFTSPLPQENGMIFILPCIYFILKYLEHRKENTQKIKNIPIEKRKIILWDLAIASIAFSLTIAIHFYDTIIAGLFIVCISIVYIFRVLNPKYLLHLVSALIIAVIIGVLPMAGGLLIGKPLQGSIAWGMKVLNEKDTSSSTNNSSTNNSSTNNSSTNNSSTNNSSINNSSINNNSSTENNLQNNNLTQNQASNINEINNSTNKKNKIEDLIKKVQNKSQNIYTSFSYGLSIILQKYDSEISIIILAGGLLLIISSIILCFLGQKEYALRQIACILNVYILIMLLCARKLGLPQLMDMNRTSVYLPYMLVILFAFLLDNLTNYIYMITKKIKLTNMFSLVLSICVLIISYKFLSFKPFVNMGTLETKGAIYCVDTILNTYDDKTWTIVSANDEFRMTEFKGYHYELISFLAEMNKKNASKLVIPTKYVFFYIEKKPLDYFMPYENSGQSISQKGAESNLPNFSGLIPYMGRNRWIVMSKMYYWIKAFENNFPQDISVFYEDDNFVCYKLTQNASNPINLYLDYGYNY